ncbi:zinc finger CCCH domain-containing protein 18-like isoform X2 [Chenopodium quinoa]|uniref:zinc finger CCCH domain-containing protein 18-like isoform X2 n=1 Tax=Chenopodium quinoa TaxID=63459 RepID=UPI000B798FCC|nr:zinc finger CCCH domain-containing protein 18-like isoform X2 [Chenopodium quinoa]
MPRSSRHKSSKHSSREVRDYSDSEKDSGLKEKKGREDGGSNISSRHLKESTSAEKRKIDSKSADVTKDLSSVAVNVDIVEEYIAPSTSKKRKEKEDDDRWTGGDIEHDLSKSDSKRSSRREGSLVVDGEEGKRSGSKAESKHHRSDRKERNEKEGGWERDRKGSKSERLVVGVTGNENVGNEGNRKQGSGEERAGKHGVGNTDYIIQEEVRNPDTERDLDRRVRRKRDGSGDGDKHQESTRELDDRRLSSREDIVRSGKYKDEGHKDERVRDRYQEDIDKENWHQDEKQRDNRAIKEYSIVRSEDKHLNEKKKDLDVSQKKSKPRGSEYERESERERDRDNDRDRVRDRERDRTRHDRDRERDRDHDDREHDLDREKDRERDLERSYERDRELDQDRERGRDRYHRERDRDRNRDRDHNHDRGRDRDYDHEFGSHVDDKSSRYKDDRGRRRSVEGYDDYHGDKSRRVESEVDKERSLPRKAHIDSVVSSGRRRSSPNSRAYVNTDKYRDGIQDEAKYGDSSRDALTSEALDKVPKYRSGEKRTKFDDNHVGESSERSPNAKASPAGLKERSPTTSVDRRFQNRTSRRRSLDVDEAERRSSGSNDVRDISVNEDRQGRDFSVKKPTGEVYPPVESPFHHKSSQGNISSHTPGPSGFRSGADSPSFMGSLGEDTRGHSGSRFRRSVDPNVGRGPGNGWKGAPNWPSPLPNGFMPFPPGPPGPHHGGFPPMLSQFPPLFGVRPSMDMNHPGMPYHMSEGDRFSGHVRPLGWQNMVDGPVHFHGWDVSNGVLRDESSMYGPGHLANAQRRDMNSDMWKPNGDPNMDVTSVSQKDGPMAKASMDEVSSVQGASRLNVESSAFDEGPSQKMITSSGPSSTKEIPMTPAKVTTEKTPESSSADETAQSVRAYLAKLDISIDMADPELYNQFINLAVKGQSELIEEVELEYTEERTVTDSEIANLSMGLTFFPTAKASIFKKAMNLYKTQSTKRSFSGIPNWEFLHSPKDSELEAEPILAQEDKLDDPVNCSADKEEPILAVPEVVSTTPVVEGKEPVSITSDEVLNDESFEGAELDLGLSNQGQTPVFMLEKVDEEINPDKELLSVENTSDEFESNTDKEVVGNECNDGMRGGAESVASDEQLDVAVSGPLVMSHDSVKVCETLMSVSNESDSVILSRIHHAPESTH